MPRRNNDKMIDGDPPKKRNCNNNSVSSSTLRSEVLTDITGKQWKLGKSVGVGGFGQIYLASDNLTGDVKTDCKYVAKVENHQSGPLFVEMNCYLRVAKPDMIQEWKKQKKLKSLGMPHYVALGSHLYNSEKYRFLILPKFEQDLEKILEEKKKLNLKTVLTISLQIIEVLEYLHSKGYVHSDIKASNLLLCDDNDVEIVFKKPTKMQHTNPFRACRKQPTLRKPTRNLRPQQVVNYVDDIHDFDKLVGEKAIDGKESQPKSKCKVDQVYLLDYGLACKYRNSNGEHKPFCYDERKAHAGTILFCSVDAHNGAQSRRSDLESLGYNIIFWLTANLPWADNVDNPELVHKKKQKAMTDIETFLRCCFTEHPKFLEDFFKYIQNLGFQENPDYEFCKRLLKQSLEVNGFKDDNKFDFDNLEKGKQKQLKVKKSNENLRVKRKVIHKISRPPLLSNIPIKPLLRKKVKNKKNQNRYKWFEDLTDPEEILKQAREKKYSKNNDTAGDIMDLDIQQLNPTSAMLEVYNKCLGRLEDIPTCKGDAPENIDGFTPAMMSIYRSKKRRHCDTLVNLLPKNGKSLRGHQSSRKRIKSPLKAPKSVIALKKDNLIARKSKSCVLRRSYSLRG